jgi:gp32 DNA binding protein like
MTFAAYKQKRQAAMEALTEEMNKMSKKFEREEDERFWQPTVDKAGNGNAIIRFLPACETENIPFIRYWEHSFKGPGGRWYIELCPTSISRNDCPVCEMNNKLWNSGQDSDRKLVSSQKRALRYVSNIIVLKDPANPDNEGQVRLFRYGKKIFDKINEKMHPTFEGDDSINPFDLIEGCNFRLKIRNVEGYRNYDKSEFEAVGPLHKDEKFMENVYNKLFPLQPFLDPSLFKSKEELQKQLNRALGDTVPVKEESIPYDLPKVGKETDTTASVDDEDVVDSDFFKSLAEED